MAQPVISPCQYSVHAGPVGCRLAHTLPVFPCASTLAQSTDVCFLPVQPVGVPSPNYLHSQAAELAGQLGLACPPLSPALWLERYCADLELPQVLLFLLLPRCTALGASAACFPVPRCVRASSSSIPRQG